MPRSLLPRVLRRAWKAVKPPPALPARRRLNRSQRRLIRATAIVVGLGASAWGVYAWIASAPERALKHFNDGDFTRAIAIDPNFAEAYRARGDAFLAAGQGDAAQADFEKAIAIDPTEWLAYLSRGMLWSSRGDHQRALTDFTQSIRLQPSAKAYYQRGLIYQTLGQSERSVNDYNLAIERDPGAPYLYRARSEARRGLGDPAGARQDREQAERIEKTQ